MKFLAIYFSIFTFLFIFLTLFPHSRIHAQTCTGSPRGCDTWISTFRCEDSYGVPISGNCSSGQSEHANCGSGGTCEYNNSCEETFFKACGSAPGCSTAGCGLGTCGETAPNCYWAAAPSPSPSGGGGGGGTPSCSITLSPNPGSVAIGGDLTSTVTVNSESSLG